MDKKIITINDEKLGNVFFVKENSNIFVILSEIRRRFNYSPVNYSSPKQNPAALKLRKSIVKMDLSGTDYHKYLLSLHKNGVLRRIREVSCIEISKFITHIKSTPQSTIGKEKTRRFLLDNFVISDNSTPFKMDCTNGQSDKDSELPKYTESNQTRIKLFKDICDLVEEAERKCIQIQNTVQYQKEQIADKDRTIATLTAKINELEEQYAKLRENGQGHLDYMRDRVKDLEEQNTNLKSQLEIQTKLNTSVRTLVSQWTALNNART